MDTVQAPCEMARSGSVRGTNAMFSVTPGVGVNTGYGWMLLCRLRPSTYATNALPMAHREVMSGQGATSVLKQGLAGR